MNGLPEIKNLTVEFKTSFNEDVIETLTAFANTVGGTVYVGVADNGKPLGITVGKETVQNWINEIKNKTSPRLIPDVDLLTVDNKIVAKIFIPEYPVKPVSVRGRYYKRTGNSNHLLGVDEIANEHLKTINSSWDFYIDPNHSETNLSKEKIVKFINKIRQNDGIQQAGLSDTEILDKMEILRNGKVTFGAYLLFVEDYCAISDVQIGRFKSDITIIDSLSLNCDLFREVEEITGFIKKHLMVEYIITGELQRTERLNYPLDAIREVVVNMVVHRDYRDSSASIIKIFDNRIEFYNPGKLYGGITVQDLLSGNYLSKSRNKLIAKIFKEVGLIERYGSGIVRIRKICREHGVKEPDFNEIANGFQVILYNERIVENTDTIEKENSDNILENLPEKLPEKLPKNLPEKLPVNLPVNVPVKLTDKHKIIIANIEKNPYVTIDELTKILSMSRPSVKNNINRLKNIGLIERVGSDKTGYWKIKLPIEKIYE